MSELSIFEKSQEIRFETEIYANTCERVANVLDDLNDTKANKTDVSAAIQDVIDELTLVEQEIYGYVDAEFTEIYTQIGSKIDKPVWTGYEQQYIVVSTSGAPTHLRPITLEAGRVPFWSGNSFFNSPIYIDNTTARIGINNALPTEALDVAGSVRANAYRFNVTASNTVPNKIWTDGTDLYHTNAAGVNAKMTGQNISNTDLSNAAARTFTQAAAFTWNTAGQPHYLKGLLDKTGNAAYTKALIIHPTTGERVTRDFADPQATTLAVQNANATQKTAMRTALLGTATPANPVLNDTSVRFSTRGINMIDLYGINLTLLDPTFLWIEKPNGDKVYAINFYNLTSGAFTSVWDFPDDLPNGEYQVKIQNGVTIQGLSNAKIVIVDTINTVTLLSADWKGWARPLNNGTPVAIGTKATFSDNVANYTIGGLQGANPLVTLKSQNIFLGNKDWDILIEASSAGASLNSVFNPYIGLTETDHSNFTDVDSIINNIVCYEDAQTSGRINSASPVMNISSPSSFVYYWIYISKVGDKLFIRAWHKTNINNFSYGQMSIDTSKNYALWIKGNSQGQFPYRNHMITARIMN